jgi:hypothetical protein
VPYNWSVLYCLSESYPTLCSNTEFVSIHDEVVHCQFVEYRTLLLDCEFISLVKNLSINKIHILFSMSILTGMDIP